VLPTGGGESVYYQVPALIFGGLTLVVTPLGPLMEDQVGRAREVGLRANNLNSEQPNSARREIGEQVRDGEVDILFVSPERLDLAALRFLLEGVDVCLLAVDEAHCINEWARDSPRPAYRRIKTLSRALACPTLALRASATLEVREDILASLSLTDPLVVVWSFDRPNLSWSIVPGGARHNRLSEAYRCVRSVGGCAIVYAPTRCSIEVVRDASALRGVSVEAYHAGLSGVERTRVQGAFMEGECRVVVATNAFGMGIDKPYVLLVVHVQLPGTLGPTMKRRAARVETGDLRRAWPSPTTRIDDLCRASSIGPIRLSAFCGACTVPCTARRATPGSPPSSILRWFGSWVPHPSSGCLESPLGRSRRSSGLERSVGHPQR
jgi:ATP-dependent DNA helicase RecQ